jgi:glycosyltransferase involved in cell wall biosynthesis
MVLTKSSSVGNPATLKILFITASLESGKDGVGDYTQRLAGALRQKGVHVLCISLADRYVSPISEFDAAIPLSCSEGFDILRLATSIPWRKRFEILQGMIDRFKPHWISLQYVPYGFNSRGLPFHLPKRLASLRVDCRWHIMFHELWIGEESGYTPFQKFIGLLQKKIVRKLSTATDALLQTSNLQYMTRLRKECGHASLLPLFSNIPFTNSLFSRGDVIEESKVELDQHYDSRGWIFVLFGTIHPEWSPESLFQKIEKLRKREGRPPCLVVVLGKTSTKMVHRVADACVSFGWGFLEKGELKPSMISSYLQCADFGLATTPYSLIGKSGSVAAMKEHGLPVIVSRIDGCDASNENGCFILLNSSFEKDFLKAQKTAPFCNLDNIAGNLIKSLTN